MKVFLKSVLVLGCAVLLIGITSYATAKSDFEKPSVLDASKILPADLISGPYHRVDDKVLNDGYVNTYAINSSFCQLKAVATALLRIRVYELSAIAAVEALGNTKEYGESVKEAGGDIVKGGKALITRPKKAIEGSLTGIGKLFERGYESLSVSKPSKYEDSRIKSLIGFSKTKRDLRLLSVKNGRIHRQN